jgi:hypothetical protein
MRKDVSPKLRCSSLELIECAQRYSYTDDNIVISLKPDIWNRGYLTKYELKRIARWKSPRSAPSIEFNPDSYFREITGFSLSAKSERARIETLTILDGVQWPMASVILHLYHRDPYPIIDFRALWSVSMEMPSQYYFDFWWEYTLYCRKLMKTTKIDKRKLDRGLWQYSKENQYVIGRQP